MGLVDRFRLCFLLSFFVVPMAMASSVTADWYNFAFANKLSIPAEIRKAANQYEFVFVAGLSNEKQTDLFAEYRPTMAALGITPGQIHLHRPISKNLISDEAQSLQKFLEKLAAQTNRPLVVLGHSRGGMIALEAGLRHARWTKDHVFKLFILSSPLQGTPVADQIIYNLAIGPEVPEPARRMCEVLSWSKLHLDSEYYPSSVRELTTNSASLRWRELAREFPQARELLDDKVEYVRSSLPASSQRPDFYAFGSYIEAYAGKNDGLVPFASQALPDFGHPSLDLRISHTHLSNSATLDGGSEKYRRAFAQWLIMRVGTQSVESQAHLLWGKASDKAWESFEVLTINQKERECIERQMMDWKKVHHECAFIHDGCDVRAGSLFFQIDQSCHVQLDQVWLTGVLNVKPPAIKWWFHTTLVFKQGESVWAVDPAFDDKPMKIEDWKAASIGSGYEKQTAFTDAIGYDGAYPDHISFGTPRPRIEMVETLFRCYGFYSRLLSSCIGDHNEKECIANADTSCQSCQDYYQKNGIASWSYSCSTVKDEFEAFLSHRG